MTLTSLDVLRLGLLMTAIGTAVLSVVLVFAYRRSPRLSHVMPLAVSYLWLSLVVTARGWDILAFEAALWNCLGAYTVGNLGLFLLMVRPWPAESAKVEDGCEN